MGTPAELKLVRHLPRVDEVVVRPGDQLEGLGAAEQRAHVRPVHLVRREAVPDDKNTRSSLQLPTRELKKTYQSTPHSLTLIGRCGAYATPSTTIWQSRDALERTSLTIVGRSMISPSRLDTWHSATIFVSSVTICSNSESLPADPSAPGYHHDSLAPDRLARLTHGPMLAS